MRVAWMLALMDSAIETAAHGAQQSLSGVFLRHDRQRYALVSIENHSQGKS